MANNTCTGVIQVCAIRVAELDADGTPTGGASSGYISDATIEVGVNVVVTEGEVKELRNGCDAICQTLTNPDRLQRIDLSATFCQLDAELIALMTGSTVITSEGNTIGVELPGPTDTVGGNGVSFEVWAKEWDGDAQADDGAGNVKYVHFVFPRVLWVPGNFTLNADFLEFPVSGKAQVNANFFDGPWNDLPYSFSKLGGWFSDDSLPTAACGYQTLPAGS